MLHNFCNTRQKSENFACEFIYAVGLIFHFDFCILIFEFYYGLQFTITSVTSGLPLPGDMQSLFEQS